MRKGTENIEGKGFGKTVDPREAQQKGVRKRKENRMARELLEEHLAKQVWNADHTERKSRKSVGMLQLAQQYARGDKQAIKLAQEILGEAVTNIAINAVPVVIGDDGLGD